MLVSPVSSIPIGSADVFRVSEAECQRSTRIAGTKGELIGDMDTFVSQQLGEMSSHLTGQTVFDFLTRKKVVHQPIPLDDSHGGGDAGLSHTFFSAIAASDQSIMKVTPQDVLHSHLTVFAAEQSRKTKTTVDFAAFKREAFGLI